MTEERITLHSAAPDDIDAVERLLTANDLPTEDVRDKPECFYVALSDRERVGVGGLEVHGTDGLLRSLVVQEPHRGSGLGAALCRALEARARRNGVRRLYLLTTTAESFFRRLGYERVDRRDVPDSIRETSEFADLCSSRATCMTTAPAPESR
jgi:amino-acid N-acetyltransferase